MTQKIIHLSSREIILASTVFVSLIGLALYNLNQVHTLSERTNLLDRELASTTEELTKTKIQFSNTLTKLNEETKGIGATLGITQKHIDEVTTQIGGVTQSVNSISGDVGTLKKLAKVDAQLLKKYSKVYFLNENYTPLHLTAIPSSYLYSDKRQEQFISEAWPFLQTLMEDAKKDGITFYIKSGYRSFTEQKSLKSSYAVKYGAGTANTFSAEQGYSEHQLGSTIDFITTGTGGNLAGFDTTTSFTWLTANAHRYGFVLSYPKGNTHYIYEPWHWRYVGTKLATYLHDTNRIFYELDQREIDTYLITMFE